MNENGRRSEPPGRYFLCVGGAGPDGAIVNGVDEIFKKNAGIVAYWVEGLKQLFRYDFPEMRVFSGGQERRATIIVIGRTAHYGGPFKITTEASLFEDSFEMLTNSSTSRLQYLACLPALWMGKLRGRKGIDTWKDTEVVCEPADDRMVYAQVDMVSVSSGSKIDIRVMQASRGRPLISIEHDPHFQPLQFHRMARSPAWVACSRCRTSSTTSPSLTSTW